MLTASEVPDFPIVQQSYFDDNVTSGLFPEVVDGGQVMGLRGSHHSVVPKRVRVPLASTDRCKVSARTEGLG